MTVKDVVYTFERLAVNSERCPNWHLFDGKIIGLDDFCDGRADSISGIKIIDEQRIEFQLTNTFTSFLKIMASPTAFIIPREAVEFYGDDFSHHPVGSGPFRLVRWQPFEKIEPARHDRYWRHDNGARLPYLDAVSIRFSSDASLAFSEFLKGESDLFRADEQFGKTLSHTIFDSTLYNIYSAPVGLTLRFLGFSLDNGSVCANNKKLRQAISQALNREDLLSEPSTFNPTPAYSLAPNIFFDSSPKEPFYNPQKAASLFKTFQHPSLRNHVTIASNVYATDVLKTHSILTDLGLAVDYHNQKGGYFQHIINDRPDMFRVAFIAGFPDPEDYYGLFFSKNGRNVNLTGHSSPYYDKTFEQALIEQNPAMRMQYLTRLEAILREDVPAIFLSHSHPTSYHVPKTISGFHLNFLFPDFCRIYMEPPNAGSGQP